MLVVTSLLWYCYPADSYLNADHRSSHYLEDMALISAQVVSCLMLLLLRAWASLELELVLDATSKSDKNLALLSGMGCVFLVDLLALAPSAMSTVTGRVGNIHDSNSQNLRQAYAAF